MSGSSESLPSCFGCHAGVAGRLAWAASSTWFSVSLSMFLVWYWSYLLYRAVVDGQWAAHQIPNRFRFRGHSVCCESAYLSMQACVKPRIIPLALRPIGEERSDPPWQTASAQPEAERGLRTFEAPILSRNGVPQEFPPKRTFFVSVLTSKIWCASNLSKLLLL